MEPKLIGDAERDRRIDKLLAKGIRQEHLVKKDILEAFPEERDNPEKIDELINVLNEMGIPVVDSDEDVIGEALLEPGEPLPENGAATAEALVTEELEEPLTAGGVRPSGAVRRAEVEPVNDPVRMYLREIGRVPLLEGEEESRLAKAIQAGVEANERLTGDGKSLPPQTQQALGLRVLQGQIAQRRLAEANLRLVVSVAKRYVGRGMSLLDLIQEGNLGLLRVVEKFDYRRGYKFSTYATWWIRQGITRALAQQSRLIRLPVHAGDQIRKIHRIAEQLEQESGRRPTPGEIAEKAEITSIKVERLLRISCYPVSLERPVGDDGDTEFGDFIEDEESPAPTEMAYQQLLREALDEVMTALSPREARILRMRFGLRDGRPHTLEEVGEKFGLTRERIRQIEHQALARLRHPHRSRQLRDYLR